MKSLELLNLNNQWTQWTYNTNKSNKPTIFPSWILKCNNNNLNLNNSPNSNFHNNPNQNSTNQINLTKNNFTASMDNLLLSHSHSKPNNFNKTYNIKCKSQNNSNNNKYSHF